MTDVVQQGPLDPWIPEWLAGWAPPGPFDAQSEVFVGPGLEHASFPDDGIDLFGDVDEQSFWFSHRGCVIVDQIQLIAGTDAVILEVGSGSGAVAEALTATGRAVLAVEPMKGGAARARERGADLAFEGTLHEAALPGGAFDVVGFFDVIEHLDDWQAVLVEARRVLRPTGHLLVTVPAHQWLWSEHDDWNEHKRRYSRRQLVRDLEASGYEVERAGHFFAPLLAPAILRRLAYLLARRHSGDSQAHEDRLRTQLRPPPLVNRLLSWMLRLERRGAATGRLPFGTSLFAVAVPARENSK